MLNIHLHSKRYKAPYKLVTPTIWQQSLFSSAPVANPTQEWFSNNDLSQVLSSIFYDGHCFIFLTEINEENTVKGINNEARKDLFLKKTIKLYFWNTQPLSSSFYWLSLSFASWMLVCTCLYILGLIIICDNNLTMGSSCSLSTCTTSCQARRHIPCILSVGSVAASLCYYGGHVCYCWLKNKE